MTTNTTATPRGSELLPCPFCRKSVACITWASELDGDWDDSNNDSCAVVCDAQKPDGPGGCGASGGFAPSEAEAIERWNTRAAIESAAAPGMGGELSQHPAIRNLIYFTEHCISAHEEGVEYAVTRPWLDAMTTMGIMEKVGRGRWTVTDAGQALIDATHPTPTVAGSGVSDVEVNFAIDAYNELAENGEILMGSQRSKIRMRAALEAAALARRLGEDRA